MFHFAGVYIICIHYNYACRYVNIFNCYRRVNHHQHLIPTILEKASKSFRLDVSNTVCTCVKYTGTLVVCMACLFCWSHYI